MTVAVALWTYAAVLAIAGGFALHRAGWVDRAPRLAIAGWQALTASLVLAVALGGLGRWMYCVVTELGRSRRVRRHHHEMLAIIGRPSTEASITLLEHDMPAAYCRQLGDMIP